MAPFSCPEIKVSLSGEKDKQVTDLFISFKFFNSSDSYVLYSCSFSMLLIIPKLFPKYSILFFVAIQVIW